METNGIAAHGNAGKYEITFNGDLSKCARRATSTGTSAGQVLVSTTVAGEQTDDDRRRQTYGRARRATDRGIHPSASS